jgi:hypothetical protein
MDCRVCGADERIKPLTEPQVESGDSEPRRRSLGTRSRGAVESAEQTAETNWSDNDDRFLCRLLRRLGMDR